jgi:hypothetical protein
MGRSDSPKKMTKPKKISARQVRPHLLDEKTTAAKKLEVSI